MLSYAQARAWVELLWEDFEATYAKAGQYNGRDRTEYVVKTWIEKPWGEGCTKSRRTIQSISIC
ncbi:hypothetical protein GCM10020331_089230 [Ectobacillus funiculus]